MEEMAEKEVTESRVSTLQAEASTAILDRALVGTVEMAARAAMPETVRRAGMDPTSI